MHYTRLGSSGLKVSRITIGCMSFSDTSRGFSEWALGDEEAQPFFQQACFTSSGWRYNFAGGRDIEVTLRGVRQPARAMLCGDPDVVVESYERLAGQLGTD